MISVGGYDLLDIGLIAVPLVSLICCVIVVMITVFRFHAKETELTGWGWVRGLFELLAVLMALPLHGFCYRKRDIVRPKNL
jgi:hypothetical protein